MEVDAWLRDCEQSIEQDIGSLAPIFVAGQSCEADEVLRRDSVWIGRCFVDRRIGTHDQAFSVIGGQIVAAGFLVSVVAIESVLPLRCAADIFWHPGSFV